MPRGGGFGQRWWHGKFKGCGYRITQGRDIILEVLSSTDEHLSAEDIYMRVHKKYPAIGLTTVYRTLDILINMGMVFKFDYGDGRARYELTESSKGKHHHHHLICTNCSRVIDYTDFIDKEHELLSQTEAGISKKYDFEITNHVMGFYGICSKCKKSKN